jgi:hypothetical protein
MAFKQDMTLYETTIIHFFQIQDFEQRKELLWGNFEYSDSQLDSARQRLEDSRSEAYI